MLGLDPGEAAANGADGELGRRRRVGAVEAEEEVEVIVAEAVEKAGVPTEGSRGEGNGGEGVADVVVAVTEGALAVLPGLAPEDGGESEEKDGTAVIGEEGREVEAGAELEGVVFGGVVGEERGGGEGGVTVRERRRKEVGFGGVEVAAAGVDAEGPGGEAGGLPGGQGEGVVEEAGEGGAGDRVRWGRKRREKRVVERGVAGERGEVEEGMERGREEAEEGVGLVGPVEAAGAAGVAVGEGMLGLVVVFYGLLPALLLRLSVMLGG